jgi:uncharacterized protein YkwD
MSTRPAGRVATLLIAAAVTALSLLGLTAAPVGASTADSMADAVVQWLNEDRVDRGLVPLRKWGRLANLAEDRAANMAARNRLSHDAAGGDVGKALNNRDIHWFSYGEIIGMSSYPWGSQAANNIYTLWKGSAPHRSIMFSDRYNYVGVGFAYRSSNKTTWASVVFTESRDHTDPVAMADGVSAKGTSVTFEWSGRDRRLQTHTSGLDSFDVQYRVDGGSWRTIRNDTNATSLTLNDRPRGHSYGFRVCAKDNRGNLSRWTSEQRVWVP